MKIPLSKEARGIIIPNILLQGPTDTARVDLILDTGAVYTLISWDTAMALGYDPARETRTLPIVTANGTIHAPWISLRRISIGGASARNVPAICHDIPEIVEVSGLLGLSFLRHFKTTLDYLTATLSIE